MEKGRKVDQSVYKDILLDVAKVTGEDLNAVNDEYVSAAWDKTGGDLRKLMENIALATGSDIASVNDDYMEMVKDKYHIVDPSYTRPTLSHVSEEEKAGFLPEQPDERQKNNLEVSFGAVDDYYKAEGNLTPVQKSALFNDRYKRKSDQLAGMPEARKAQELNNYAKVLADDLGMEYDPSARTYVVPSSEWDKYDILLGGTYLDPKEVRHLVPTVDDLEKENEEIERVASIVKSNEPRTRDTSQDNLMFKAMTYDPLSKSGTEIVDYAEKNAASIFAKNTRDNIELIKKLEDANGVEETLRGIKKGVSDHFTGIFKLLRQMGSTQRVTRINQRLGDIYDEVLTSHPEWRYRDKSLYQNGVLLPPDNEADVRQKRMLINEEVNRLVNERFSMDDLNVLNAFNLNVESLEALSKASGVWFNRGAMIGQSIGFMGEFTLTSGLSGSIRVLGTQAIKKGITKATATRLVSMMSDSGVLQKTLGTFAKAASTKAGSAVVKGGRWLGRNAAETSIQTIMQPSFMSNVAREVAAGKDIKSVVADTFEDMFIENFSERIFVGKAKPTKVLEESNFVKRAFDKVMYRAGRADYGRRGLVNKIIGTVEEMSEEKIGDLLRGAHEAIDRNNINYLTSEIWKPEDIDMMWVTAIMTGSFGAFGGLTGLVRGSHSVESLRYRASKLSKALPPELREKLDVLIEQGRLGDAMSDSRIAKEINGAIDGLYGDDTRGGEGVKKRKELSDAAVKYFLTTNELYYRSVAEEFVNDPTGSLEKVDIEGEKFVHEGKEVVATDTATEEGMIEVMDENGNREVVDFDALTPVGEATETGETKKETTGKETGEIITEPLKTGTNAEETRRLREESEREEQGKKQGKESERLGRVPEVNRVEAAQEEEVRGEEVEGEVEEEPGLPGLNEKLDELSKKVRAINQAANNPIKAKYADNLKEQVKKIKGVIKENKAVLTPAQYKSIMTDLSKSIKSKEQFNRLMNKINGYIAKEKGNILEETRAKLIKKARKHVKKNVKDSINQSKLLQFLNTDPSRMSPQDQSLFYDIVEDIKSGRYSELSGYIMENYPMNEEERTPITSEQVQKYVDNVKDRLKKMGDTLDEASFEDLNRYTRSLSAIRNKAANMFNDGDISADTLQEINDSIDEFMNGPEDGKGFVAANEEARKAIRGMIDMELDDAVQKHPYNILDPVSVMVNTIYNNIDNVDTLTNTQLSRLYNSLYNVNNGFHTKELASAMEDLIRHDVKGSLASKVVPALDNGSIYRRYKRYRDNSQKLAKDLAIKDLNTAEYLLYTAEGTPIYDNIVAMHVEPAMIAAEVSKAKMLEEFSAAARAFDKYYSLKEGRLKSKGTVYLNLAGMLMVEQDYQTNDLAGKMDTTEKKYRSYFNALQEKDFPNRRVRELFNDAMAYFKFRDDGTVDVEATMAGLPVTDRKILQDVMNAARKLWDGPLKEYNIANAKNRGYIVKFFEKNYAPRQVKGIRTDIAAIQTLEDMASRNYNGMLPAPSAIKAREGGIHMVETNIAKMVRDSVDEAVLEFNIVHSYNGIVNAFNDIARAEGRSKKENGATNEAILREFVTSIKNRIVSVHHLDKLNNTMSGILGMAQRYVNSAARVSMLVNVPKLATEVITNWVGGMMSDGLTVNPVEAINNVYQVRDMGEMFEYYNVPDAGTMMRLSEISRSIYGTHRSENQKLIDSWIRYADKLTSSNIYITNFNKEFKALHGEDLDAGRWMRDDKYKRDIRKDFMKAHAKAINQAQVSFSTLSPVSQAYETRLVPYWRKSNISREHFAARASGFMLSFAMKEAEMIGIGFQKFNRGLLDGNEKLAKEGFTLIVSRLVRSMAYPITRPILGSLLAAMWAGDDDDDGAAWNDLSDRMLKAGTQNLAGLFFGRYGNVAQLAESLIMGITRMAENDDLLPRGSYDLSRSIMGYLSYAKALDPTSISARTAFDELLPGIGYYIGVIADNYDNMYTVVDKLNRGKSLTEDETWLYDTAAGFFALMTLVVPNIFTANLRSIAADGASYRRRVERNKSRQKKLDKELVKTNIKF